MNRHSSSASVPFPGSSAWVISSPSSCPFGEHTHENCFKLCARRWPQLSSTFRLHKQQTLLQKCWGRCISTSGDMLLASCLLSRSLGVSAAMSPTWFSSRSFLGTRKYLHGHHGSRHKRLYNFVGLEGPDIPPPLTLAMRHSRTATSPRIQDKRPEPRGRSQGRGRRPPGLWSW